MSALGIGWLIGCVAFLLMFAGAMLDRYWRRREQEKRERVAIKRWAEICGVKQVQGETLHELRVRVMRAMAGRRDA